MNKRLLTYLLYENTCFLFALGLAIGYIVASGCWVFYRRFNIMLNVQAVDLVFGKS